MPTTTDELIAVRDAAHLTSTRSISLRRKRKGSSTRSACGTRARPRNRRCFIWAGRSPAYRNAQREALALRDDVNESLAALGAVVPPLPPTDGTVQWSAQDW
jgi:hypothetical protein